MMNLINVSQMSDDNDTQKRFHKQMEVIPIEEAKMGSGLASNSPETSQQSNSRRISHKVKSKTSSQQQSKFQQYQLEQQQ